MVLGMRTVTTTLRDWCKRVSALILAFFYSRFYALLKIMLFVFYVERPTGYVIIYVCFVLFCSSPRAVLKERTDVSK